MNYRRNGKKIYSRTPYEMQETVYGGEDVNEKLDREIARDYAAICFAALAVIIVVYASIGTLKWTIAKLGIHLVWWQFALVFGVLWCVVIGVIMWFGMRNANLKNLYNDHKEMGNDRKAKMK